MLYNRLTCIMDLVGDIAKKNMRRNGGTQSHCRGTLWPICCWSLDVLGESRLIQDTLRTIMVHSNSHQSVPYSVIIPSFFKPVPWTRALFPRDQTTTWKKQFTLILFVLNRNPTPTSWVVVVEIWLTELLPSQNGILPTIWSSPCRRCFPTLHLRLSKIWRSENLWEKGHGYFDYL